MALKMVSSLHPPYYSSETHDEGEWPLSVLIHARMYRYVAVAPKRRNNHLKTTTIPKVPFQITMSFLYLRPRKEWLGKQGCSGRGGKRRHKDRMARWSSVAFLVLALNQPAAMIFHKAFSSTVQGFLVDEEDRCADGQPQSDSRTGR